MGAGGLAQVVECPEFKHQYHQKKISIGIRSIVQWQWMELARAKP
jgi:hypothetical protein